MAGKRDGGLEGVPTETSKTDKAKRERLGREITEQHPGMQRNYRSATCVTGTKGEYKEK